jgi:hypothetical protein
MKQGGTLQKYRFLWHIRESFYNLSLSGNKSTAQRGCPYLVRNCLENHILESDREATRMDDS